jgi:hypothetical protein
MSAGKNQHVAFDRTHTAHNAIGPNANLVWGFSAGATVAEQLPVGTLGLNLRRSQTFIFAIVPLDQVAISFGCAPEAGQFAGASGALQRTREDLREKQSGQSFPKPTGVAFAALREWQIGKSRMLPRETPRGFPVPRKINRGQSHWVH